MSYQIGVRLNEAEYQGVQASCRRYGKTAAEVIRYFVDVCLQNPPEQKPAPQPAPQPVPQPAPQPAPSAGAFPIALGNRISDLREDMYKLDRAAAIERWKYWSPKGLAALSLAEAFFTHSGHVMFGALGVMLALLAIDAVWRGRIIRQEVAERGANQMWELILAVPGLWEQECQRRSPDLALAEVLAIIKERRDRVGQLGVKDLGVLDQAIQAYAEKDITLEGLPEVLRHRVLGAPRF